MQPKKQTIFLLAAVLAAAAGSAGWTHLSERLDSTVGIGICRQREPDPPPPPPRPRFDTWFEARKEPPDPPMPKPKPRPKREAARLA